MPMPHLDVAGLLQAAEKSRTKDHQRFIEAMDALEQKQTFFTEKQGEFYQYLSGYRLAYLGEYDQALTLYESLLARTEDQELAFRVRISITNMLALLRRYSESINYLDQALEQLDEIDNKDVKHRGLLVASVVYRLLSNHELSASFAELVLNDEPTERNACSAMHNKMRYLLNAGKMSPEDAQIDAAIERCERIGESIYSNIIRVTQANMLIQNGLAAQALELLLSHRSGVEETRYSNLIGLYNNTLAKAYWQLQQHELSREYAEKTVNQHNQQGFSIQLRESLDLLYQYHSLHNDYKQALSYHERLLNADKAYLDDAAKQSLAFQMVKHQNVEKNQRIELLNKENELLKLEKIITDKAAENNKLLILLLSLILLGIFIWAHAIRAKAKGFKKLADYDQLTGVFARNHFDQVMQRLLKTSEKKKDTLSFCIFDLDHFKQVNDKYGHMVGDWVLRKVMEACRRIPCNRCNFGRLGGEEFAIVMEGAGAARLAEFAEKCRAELNDIDTGETGYTFMISASFGVTDTSISGRQYTDLLTHADEAMYQSKSSGRNRVVVYQARQTSQFKQAVS